MLHHANPVKNTVLVRTGGRLHFGPLSWRPRKGRHFGGVGAMIDVPGARVRCTVSDRAELVGPDDTVRRVAQALERYRRRVPPDSHLPLCRIEVRSSLPAHCGLGSGTQLALAVAKGLSILANEEPVGAVELARRVGRGRRSSIGIHGFEHGGLLVDAGKLTDEEIGPLAARVAMPENWRFVIALPESSAGISGRREDEAFERLPPLPQTTTGRLCRIALTGLLPAVRAGDFQAAARSLSEYGRTVGEHFAAVQGGIFADHRIADLAGELGRSGVSGIAQSSWGPALAILTPDETTAAKLVERLTGDNCWRGCRFRVAVPLNRGAVVSTD